MVSRLLDRIRIIAIYKQGATDPHYHQSVHIQLINNSSDCKWAFNTIQTPSCVETIIPTGLLERIRIHGNYKVQKILITIKSSIRPNNSYYMANK